ncbi:MAG: NADH-quinone oxidoreductase subunit N [bacterium]|nr:NADH-quinone oxidoreductase subunit N [bacterium]
MEFFSKINLILPEIAILLFIGIQLFLSFFCDASKYKVSKWISILGIFISAALCSKVQIEPICYAFNNSVISDSFTMFFKLFILISSFLLVFLTKRALAANRSNAFRFNALFLTNILGALVLVSANDFLTMFLALEIVSVSSTFMLAYDNGYFSKESALKFFVISLVATAIFLFGVAYLYGISNSFNFSEIYEFFDDKQPTLLYSMAVIMIVSGLSFKIGILPFSNWIVDIYEGSSTSILGILSIVPKLALFGILTRLLVFPLSYSYELTFVLVLIATLTAIWANLLAIRQRNIKKLLACCVSANSSYVLFSAALVSVYNLSTVLFYLISFVFMYIGVVAAIVILENSPFSNKLYEFKNFAYTNPIFTLCFAICILGLAGIPLTSGFVSKIYLLSAIVRSGLVFLPFLIIIVLTIVVSMYYYLNVIRYMFEKSDKVESAVVAHKTGSSIIILYFCTIITLILGLCPEKVIELCQLIAYNV